VHGVTFLYPKFLERFFEMFFSVGRPCSFFYGLFETRWSWISFFNKR